MAVISGGGGGGGQKEHVPHDLSQMKWVFKSKN